MPPTPAEGQRPPARAPLLNDVARLAGVSAQTVSRVVNASGYVSVETRTRVERAVEQLGYRPNRAARALATRRTSTMGVIASDSRHWGPASVRRAVEHEARRRGYAVSAVDLESVTGEELAAAIDHLLRQDVEGIVVVAARDETLAAVQAQRPTVPLVLAEGDAPALTTVGVDQAAGSRLATEHLIALGHRCIAHVAGPADWPEARAREQGWRHALGAAGLAVIEPWRGDWSPDSGYEAGRALAARHDVSAAVVANDQMALGVLRALHEGGRRVPDDVSLVGFDDIPEAAYLLPPLTTVRQDFAAVGVRCMEALHALIEGDAAGAAPAVHRIPADLVVRASTGPWCSGGGRH
ncbi:MAG: substrate-binding domain-containing protein [Kineosporiaceae bacterium]